MDNKVVPFPTVASARSPLAHFIRIGEAHKKIADLHAAGRLPTMKVVFEASRLRYQRELIAVLRDEDVEIVLDTEVAELAALAKCGSHSRHAPWANTDQGTPLGPEFFKHDARSDVIGQIARFAVVNHVDTVLAPTHYLADPAFSNWLTVDRQACLLLRKALDREGGQHIAIDYPVITPHTSLNSDDFRGQLAETIFDLPVDNIMGSGVRIGIGCWSPNDEPLSLGYAFVSQFRKTAHRRSTWRISRSYCHGLWHDIRCRPRHRRARTVRRSDVAQAAT